MDIIQPQLRASFREFCGTHVAMRIIQEAFSSAGVEQGPADWNSTASVRRVLVERYYSTLSWGSISDCRRFLSALTYVLDLSDAPEVAKEALRAKCRNEGLQVSGNTVTLKHAPSRSEVRNLIFAADGGKPQIVLRDALENRIEVVRNSDSCLIYDRVISEDGLSWSELLDWWTDWITRRGPSQFDGEFELAERLERSLSSPPESVLFHGYMSMLAEAGSSIPALLPQVYLHFDPYTERQHQRAGTASALARQRMDFLLLLPRHTRVVVEVDGRQHYSTDDDRPSPKKYAEMVAEDRRLRLSGYEVFRFGGYELQGKSDEQLVVEFFTELFRLHGVW